MVFETYKHFPEPNGTCSEHCSALSTWPQPKAILNFPQMQFPWNLLEPARTFAEPTPYGRQTRHQLLGTYWNLLATYSVLGTWSQPNATSQNCNSHGTCWKLLERLWKLQPALAKLDFSFSEVTGSCSEPIRFWQHGASVWSKH